MHFLAYGVPQVVGTRILPYNCPRHTKAFPCMCVQHLPESSSQSRIASVRQDRKLRILRTLMGIMSSKISRRPKSPLRHQPPLSPSMYQGFISSTITTALRYNDITYFHCHQSILGASKRSVAKPQPALTALPHNIA